jgi:hypothetical protein
LAEQQPSDQPPAETAPIVPAATATQTPTPNKETPEVILKCLIMLFELMQSSDITSLNATLQTILDEFVKTSVSSVNVEIKMTALKTMGKTPKLPKNSPKIPKSWKISNSLKCFTCKLLFQAHFV